MATFKSAAAWGEALKKRITELDAAFGRVVATVHGEQVHRIFEQGESGSGDKIGTYDTSKPLYVNPKNAPKKFKPMGKPSGNRKRGETKFKDGQDHKTRYFPNYKSFRDSQGRQTAFVDLKLSGQLQSDYANSLQKQGNTWVAGTTNPVNTGKLEGAMEKYGADVPKLQEDERKLLTDTLREERIRIGV